MEVLWAGPGHLFSFFYQILPNEFIKLKTISRNKGDYLWENLKQSKELPYFNYVIFSLPASAPLHEYLEILYSKLDRETTLIFLSSTSIYKKSEIGLKLKSIEIFIQNNFNKSIFVRPGGLVDHIRHPANFLKNKTELINPDDSVNLIHTEDLALFLLHLINKNIQSGTFDLISPIKISRKKFYLPLLKHFFQLELLEVPQKETRNTESKEPNPAPALQTNFSLKYPDLLTHFLQRPPLK